MSTVAREKPKQLGPMSVIGLNDLVVWYADADVHGPGDYGFVTQVSGEAITCITWNKAGGVRIRPSVRHRSDEKLRHNDEIRKDGCWDFHPTVRRVFDLEERMNAIESLVGEFVAPEAPKAINGKKG